jgi:ribonuclease BN (tRNA processing enzyme)
MLDLYGYVSNVTVDWRIVVSLQIQMIGTGSAFGKSYYNNNALVTSNEYTLLIDCGVTAPRALHELNIEFTQIDAIFISHIHADHIGGLEELAFQLTYKYKHRMKLFLPDTIVTTLWEHSLRGGLENIAEGFTCLQDYFEVVALSEGLHELAPGLNVELLRTEHIQGKPSYSLIINDKLFYSADAKFNYDLLVDLSDRRGIKHIMHDCLLSGPGVVHASLDELLTLPEHIQKKVLLMHYSDNMPKYIGQTGQMSFIEQFKKYEF